MRRAMAAAIRPAAAAMACTPYTAAFFFSFIVMPYRLMYKLILLFSIASLIVLLSGCDADDHSSDFNSVQTSIIYQSSSSDIDKVQVLRDPSALLVIDENQWFYLERATRKIIKMTNGTRQTFADLSPYEPLLQKNTCYNDSWGEDFILIDEYHAMIASPNKPLIWVDLQTADVSIVGRFDGLSAAPGLSLNDINFESFGGIGRSKNGLYLAFDNRIYKIDLLDYSPQVLLQSKLQLVAGSDNPNASPDDLNALQAALSLDTYTSLAEFDDVLYFWESPRLRAVKNDRILTVTGDGYSTSLDSLDDFYAFSLPYPPRIRFYNGDLYSSYWKSSDQFLKIQIDNLDFITGKASGRLDVFFPPCEKISDFKSINQHFMIIDNAAGSIWKLPADDLSSGTCLYGPKSSEEYFESIQNDGLDSPYASSMLISPLSIESFMNGNGALIYEPTLERLSYFVFDSQNVTNIRQGAIDNYTTDHIQHVYYQDGYSLNFMEVKDDGQLDFSYVQRFFNTAPDMGVPCPGDVFHLTEAPYIDFANNQLMIFTPNAAHVFSYHMTDDILSEIHGVGWVRPGSQAENFYNAGLDSSTIERWKTARQIEASILNEDNKRFLVVSGLSRPAASVAGVMVSNDKSFLIAGFGQSLIADQLPLADTRFDDILSLDITLQNQILIAAPDSAYVSTQDGVWQKLESSCFNHNSFNELHMIGTVHKPIYIALQSDGFAYCIDNDTNWGSITSKDDLISTCDDENTIVYTRSSQLCVKNFLNPSDDSCVTMPESFVPKSLACNGSNIAVSGSMDTRYVILQTEIQNLNTPAGHLGLGAGLPDKIDLLNATFGMDVGRMAMDDMPNLYLWMRDTCTIWSIPADKPFEATTLATRLMTDNRLCHSSAMTVTPSGNIYFVDQKIIYHIDGDKIIPMAQIPEDAIDMTAVGEKIAILAKDGLYEYHDFRINRIASSPIQIDGQSINFAIPASLTPRLTQSPGENAVLIPVFQNGRIIKISLD